MKKVAVLLLCIMALGLVVSCATKNHEVALSQNKAVKGKNGVPRPDWVIYDQSNAINHYVSGYGTGTTFEVARQKAQLNADAELAIWVSDSVKAVRERYISENVIGENTVFLDKFESTATEMGVAVLSGVREVDYWEDIDGGIWVLRSIPVSNVRSQINTAISTTCADETLFASTAEAKAVMEKLEKALDEYFPVE